MNARRAANQPRWRGHAVHAVLFDLDGTLLDTVEDIALAFNRALGEKQFDTLTTAQVRDLIGRGVPTLITRAIARLGIPVDPAARASLLERFYFHYGRLHMLDECNASVYPASCRWPRRTARARPAARGGHQQAKAFCRWIFCSRLGLQRRGSTWWSAATRCERRKPDPQPLQFACATLRVEPSASAHGRRLRE